LMDVPEIDKPHLDWCKHALCAKTHPTKTGAKSTLMPATGCAIYNSRPKPCRDFKCIWLINQAFGDEWFPAHAKIVIDIKIPEPCPDRNKQLPIVYFLVDPEYPLRWREEPWFSGIKTIAQTGMTGKNGQRWKTIVSIKDQTIPIIADRPPLNPAHQKPAG
jgi:hypothetical protein